MKEILKNTGIIFFLVVSNYFDVHPQSCSTGLDSSDGLEMRLGDILNKNISLEYYSMTRFMHNYLAGSLESWTSPSTSILVDGIPYSVLPFNFNSVDLLSLDQLQTAEINIVDNRRNENGILSSLGSINLKRKEIEDSLKIRFRGYVGSETGDPLIHTFTRPNSPAVNINKIPLSGAVSFSDGISKLKYRLILGYFAHFSSSSVNDAVMSYRNPRFYSKLDKQVLASAELEAALHDRKKLKFNSSFMSCYGWDIPPFIGNIIHFEIYLYSVRAAMTNILNGFNLTLKSDGSFNEINGMTGIPPSKFLIMENSIIPEWEIFSSEKLNFTIVPEVNLYSIKNRKIDAVPEVQNFFSEEFDKINLAVSGRTAFNFSESLQSTFNLRLERHLYKRSAFSLCTAVSKKLSRLSKLTFSAASIARFPSVSDLFGKFIIYEQEEPGTVLYTIEGSGGLKEERINYLGIDFEIFLKNLNISGEVFVREILKPIIQENLSIKRTNNPGDILRNAVYTNGERKSGFGFIISSRYNIIKPMMMNFSYRFIKNYKTDFFPRHKIIASLNYKFPFRSSIEMSWFYRENSSAQEYNLSSINDLFFNSGFSGNIPENSYLNFSFEQNISPFYIFEVLSFRISIENIFDRKLKFFPIGNEGRRTIIFFISGRI
jgi:hypothetical protein